VILFKKLNDLAIIPKVQTDGAAGFDLHCVEETSVWGGEVTKVMTGLACAIPDGYLGLIKPRSGLAAKWGINVLGGVIDSDYRGELIVLLTKHTAMPFDIHPGERIAQLIVVPCMNQCMEVGDLDSTTRGVNGFGSTGE